MAAHVSGTEPGMRQLNGPQTTGRSYSNLSRPAFTMTTQRDVSVTLRDGGHLMADVRRPDSPDRFPALIAASPYPRQIQDLGAPLGFVESGASDFFVPRGYAHVIANLRSTGGSSGTFGFFDAQERQDMYDLVEWTAAQPWCDGNVGMIGISYFAMTQLEAAVEQPPHLKAIFPMAVTPDLYEAAYHNGLLNSTFMGPFLAAMGVTSNKSEEFWHGPLLKAVRTVLAQPRLHAHFAHMNGEAAASGLKTVLRGEYHSDPWDTLWNEIAVEHQVRDDFWDERNVLPLLANVTIPVYLGCDWQNVPLHLPGTFTAWEALSHNPHVRMGLLGDFGLTWPWESLHEEALAWFDQHLKGKETGILDGDPIRFLLPGTNEWRALASWPPPEAVHRTLHLTADGALTEGAHPAPDGGSRQYLTAGGDLGRPTHVNPPSLPSFLTWETPQLTEALTVVGEMELVLEASITANDTSWIVLLQDVAPDGSTTEVTAGFLRASLRQVDGAASRPGAPVLPLRSPELVPAAERVTYRIPLVPNARLYAAGHRVRLLVTSDDQNPAIPAIMRFRHPPSGTRSVTTVFSNSHLLLPILPELPATSP